MEGLIVLGVILVLLLLVFFNSLKIVQEYERGVVFRLGRLKGASGPGWFFIIPFGIDRYVKVDLRTLTMEVPTQETITRDNVSVRVNAVLYFRVFDPVKAIVNVIDFIRATMQISQTTLRSVIGQSELDDLLSRRDKINESLQHIIDEQTEPWGIKVTTVEIKDVELPQPMQRAMARQAEAERERRAKIISAEGELMASQKLAEAAHVMGQEKQAIQLRYLQTLSEISIEKNSTIVFPLPIELLSFFSDKSEKKATQSGAEIISKPSEPEPEKDTAPVAQLPEATTDEQEWPVPEEPEPEVEAEPAPVEKPANGSRSSRTKRTPRQ
jgi:regulator of protease activity HflC (stomatin/prohibitin superfamily)